MSAQAEYEKAKEFLQRTKERAKADEASAARAIRHALVEPALGAARQELYRHVDTTLVNLRLMAHAAEGKDGVLDHFEKAFASKVVQALHDAIMEVCGEHDLNLCGAAAELEGEGGA